MDHMSIVQRIEAYLANSPLTEDGDSWDIKPQPPCSAEEIAAIESELGYALPEETKALLEYCRGFDGGVFEGFDFWGEDAKYLYPTILRGRFREIAQDGTGNFWFYWKGAGTGDLGPVFYYFHEGPVYFYQCDRLVQFVDAWMRYMATFEGLINDVSEFRIRPLKEINKDLLSRDAAMASNDAVLREFAEPLEQGTMVSDFRSAKIGDGVDLQKLDVTAVHPRWPILAVRQRATLFGKLKSLLGGK